MKLNSSQGFVEVAKSELSAWEQHIMELQHVVEELRVDAARCSRNQVHTLSRIIVGATYVRV